MTRLKESDWLDHGLKTLARTGFASLKAAKMVKDLGVTRGSFYWHFEDIQAFEARLLDHWQQQTTDAIIRELDAQDEANQRLPDLMVRAYAANPRLDSAVRVWAAYDNRARAHLLKVDMLRMDYICTLLMNEGLDEDTARARARFLYAASLGDPHIAPDAAAPFSTTDLQRLATLLATT